MLWYVPQLVTDGEEGSYYCWTVSGEPNPETYPCWAGPMFIPFDQTIDAGFVHSGPAGVGETISFTNTSTSTVGLNFDWDFGDLTPHSDLEDPSHAYSASGYYTVTMTATNTVAAALEVQVIAVAVPPIAGGFAPLINLPGQPIQFINNSIGGSGYTWDFGDGTSQSAETNPSHSYTSAGVYDVTLTATNPFGTDQVEFTVAVGYPLLLPFIER